MRTPRRAMANSRPHCKHRSSSATARRACPLWCKAIARPDQRAPLSVLARASAADRVGDPLCADRGTDALAVGRRASAVVLVANTVSHGIVGARALLSRWRARSPLTAFVWLP